MRDVTRLRGFPAGSSRLIFWGAATWAVLRLRDAPIFEGRSICGPWGCGPTIPALLAAHGFWLMVAIPPAVWAARRLGPGRATRLGWACLGLAGSGIGAVVVGELARRLHLGPPGSPSYAAERVLFALATTVQVPLVPTALAGLLLLGAGSRGRGAEPGRAALAPEDAGDECRSGACGLGHRPDRIGRSSRIAPGAIAPAVTLLDRDGQPFGVARGRRTLLYFMRDPACSICRRHVRALGRLVTDARLPGVQVLVIHPARPEATGSLRRALCPPFAVASARGTGAYEAFGLSGRGLGLIPGSGTFLIDEAGIVRHCRRATVPIGAFCPTSLLRDYGTLGPDGDATAVLATLG